MRSQLRYSLLGADGDIVKLLQLGEVVYDSLPVPVTRELHLLLTYIPLTALTRQHRGSPPARGSSGDTSLSATRSPSGSKSDSRVKIILEDCDRIESRRASQYHSG